MIRAILFDLDNTVLDFPRRSDARRLFRAGAQRCYAYLSAHELALPPFETFCRRQRRISRRVNFVTWLTGGEPDGRRMLRRLCRDYRLQRDETCLAKLGWCWYEPIAATAELADDVIPTLTALREAGLALGLVVNTSHQGAVIDSHLSDLGLLEFFPVRAYSSEIGAQKPWPHLYLHALEQLGLPPGRTMFVGDEPKTDLSGAKRLGMKTVLRSADHSRRALRYADDAINRISELLDILQIATAPSTRAMPIPALMV